MNTKTDILATLTYFNMFDYPLKKRELFIFLPTRVHPYQFNQALDGLLSENQVFKLGEFYSLFNNHELAARRGRGNQKAEQLLRKAIVAARIIAGFPFVKGVAVSGSLSKRFAADDADIDFFIITEANRLWIARTFLHLLKKITFLFGRQHYYCMNYFVDEEGLCILEKNIYTAIEVATLIPMFGSSTFESFYKANGWTLQFLPNKYMHVPAAADKEKHRLQRFLENILRNRAGDIMDVCLMNLTAWSWNRKTSAQQLNSKGAVMGMHSGRHFSKPDPMQFQRKLLQRYNKSLQEIFLGYNSASRAKKETL